MQQTALSRILVSLAALLLAIVVLAPVVWLLILSVSPTTDIYTVPLRWIPSHLDLSRFGRLLSPDASGHTSPFLLALRNSLVVGGCGTAIALAVSALAGWHISRVHQGDGLLHVMVGTYMLPQTVMALPLYVMLSSCGLLNHPAGLIVADLGFLVPFTTWLMKTGFDQIPRDLDDAARVDGLGAFGTLRHIAIPLARASIATTALFALLMAWDEFFYALLFTSNADAKTVTVAIVDFTSGRVSDYGLVAAAGVIAGLPPVVIGFLLQRHLVSGLLAGGVKG
jgi:multiple sugar transport system permease protein